MHGHIGVSTYGVVDQVPGVLYVATRMMHFCYLPVFPLGGIIVLEPDVFGDYQFFETQFNFRSPFYLLLRVILALLACWFLGIAFHDPIWAVPGVFFAWMWWWSHRVTHASFERASELADAIQLDRQFIVKSFRKRGLPLTPIRPPRNVVEAKIPEPKTVELDDVFRLE